MSIRRAVLALIGGIAGLGIFLFAAGASDAQFKAVLLAVCAALFVVGGAVLAATLGGSDDAA